MTDEELKQMASAMGKKGGASTRDKYGTSHFQKIGKLSAEKRWAKHREEKDKERQLSTVDNK